MKPSLGAELKHFGLTQEQLATTLRVTPRTVRRWVASGNVPGPVRECFRVWRLMKLHRMSLPWEMHS